MLFRSDSTPGEILEQAGMLAPVADAVYVPDNRYGRVHMSGLAAAAILLGDGHDPVLEVACRHRNRVALISDLLGARALGVTSLMLVRGKKAPEEFFPQARQVADTRVTELVAIARNVYQDEALGQPINHLLGTTATVHNPEEDWNPERLGRKIEAGTHYIQTQLCLDIELLRRYVQRLVAQQVTRKVSLVVSTAALPSVAAAERLRAERGHILIPEDIVRQMRAAADPEQAGIELCAEFVRAARDIPGVSRVQLSSEGNLAANIEVLQRCR